VGFLDLWWISVEILYRWNLVEFLGWWNLVDSLGFSLGSGQRVIRHFYL